MEYARLLRIPQYFRNLQRLGEITTVFVKHGFGDIVDRLELYSYLESGLRILRPKIVRERPTQLDLPTRLRLACEELGPTFIKLGQLIASRPDIFPEPFIREFRKLQDCVPPFPVEHAIRVIESDLGCHITEAFSSFNETPIAAASIAQVHQAATRSGVPVVVKVQRPNLERILESDLDILLGIATLIEEHFPETQTVGPVALIEEFARNLRHECDFRREAASIKRFARNFRNEPGLVVPEVIESLSARHVLTEGWISGIKADEREALVASGVDAARVMDTLTRVVLKSIFEHRFFHGDPHPGNVLVLSDSRVGLIDFGAMGRLDQGRVTFALRFLTAVLTYDLDRMVRLLADADIAPPGMDTAQVKNQLGEILDFHLSQSLGRLDLARLLGDIFEVVRQHGMRPPVDLILVGKSLSLLISIGQSIDPEFKPLDAIRPYLKKRYAEVLTDPRQYTRFLTDVTDSYQKLLVDMPRELGSILRALSHGRFVLATSSSDQQALMRHQNALLNRFLMTLIGITTLTLGVLLFDAPSSRIDRSIAYIFLVLGALILAGVWISIRRSGGTLNKP